MNDVLIISESLLNAIIDTPRKYCGEIIDITHGPDNLITSLDWNQIVNHKILEEFNVTKDDLLREEIERKIRFSAKKESISVISLDKINTESETELIDLLKKNRIILLK